LPSADIAAAKATKDLTIDDHEDSDSEGELQIDMESQEAKRRASSGEEAKPDNNINAEDLLEELYGGFEKEESDENSQSSTQTSEAKVATTSGDDTPEILSPEANNLYVEIPSDEEETNLHSEQKTAEQLEKEHEMLANLERERDRLNAIVEESDKEPTVDEEDELEEGELTDSTEDENEEAEACEDESPLSPDGTPDMNDDDDAPEEIPLNRLESDGEASEDSDVEVVHHQKDKEFRKYWEDFEEETTPQTTTAKDPALDGKGFPWDGNDPLFKRRTEINSPVVHQQEDTIQPPVKKSADDSCVYFSRRQSDNTNEMQEPPPPLINPAKSAANKIMAKESSADPRLSVATTNQDLQDEAHKRNANYQLNLMASEMARNYGSAAAALKSLGVNPGANTMPNPRQSSERMQNERNSKEVEKSAIDKLRNWDTKSKKGSNITLEDDSQLKASIYEHLAVDLEHARTPPLQAVAQPTQEDGHGEAVFTTEDSQYNINMLANLQFQSIGNIFKGLFVPLEFTKVDT
jgi:hypothetical protein